MERLAAIAFIVSAGCASQQPRPLYGCPAPTPPPPDCWAANANPEALVDTDLPGEWPGIVPSRAVDALRLAHSAGIRYCSQAADFSEAAIAYPLRFRLWVNPSGSVAGVRVLDSNGADAMGRCVARCAATWRFPPTKQKAWTELIVDESSKTGPLQPAECAMRSALEPILGLLVTCMNDYRHSNGSIRVRVSPQRAVQVRAHGVSSPNELMIRCMAGAVRKLNLPNDTGHDMYTGLDVQMQ